MDFVGFEPADLESEEDEPDEPDEPESEEDPDDEPEEPDELDESDDELAAFDGVLEVVAAFAFSPAARLSVR